MLSSQCLSFQSPWVASKAAVQSQIPWTVRPGFLPSLPCCLFHHCLSWPLLSSGQCPPWLFPSLPCLTVSIIPHNHLDLVTKCEGTAFLFVWWWKIFFTFMKTPSDANNCKMSTKLSWKRYNARNVAVNWSELVCSPPRRQPLSIHPLQGSETNTQRQRQRYKYKDKDKDRKTGQIWFVSHLHTDNIDPPL